MPVSFLFESSENPLRKEQAVFVKTSSMSGGLRREVSQIVVQHSSSDERRRLAKCYNNVGYANLETGNEEKAAKSLQNALDIYEKMERKSNLSTKSWGNYASLIINLGKLNGENENLADARKFFEKAGSILEMLTNENPDRLDFALKLGGNYINLGNMLVNEDAAAAVVQYDKSIATLEKVVTISPGDAQARSYLCYAYSDPPVHGIVEAMGASGQRLAKRP